MNLPGKEAEGLSGKRKAEGDDVVDGSTDKASASTLPRKKRAKEPNPLSMRNPKKANDTKIKSHRPAKKRKQEI